MQNGIGKKEKIMGLYVAFYVHCTACGHMNRPNRKVTDGVKEVLVGKFTSCRKCGEGFKKITVPERPSVVLIRKDLKKISKKVEFVNYKGMPQYAEGIV
jgi:hypothetical protein